MKPVQIKNLLLGEGMPKICVPLVADEPSALLSQAALLKTTPADLAEWRIDWMDHILSPGYLSELLPLLRNELGELPLLITFRTLREGGRMPASWAEYETAVTEAICSGLADAVDVELFAGEGAETEDGASVPEHTWALPSRLIALAKEHGVRVILSSHDFNTTPSEEEIISRLTQMDALGGDIAKIAVMPQCPEDVLALLSATARTKNTLSCPVITMSMKGTGLISRLCGEVFGSCLTFGSAGEASAPGQIDAGELHHILEVIHENLKPQ